MSERRPWPVVLLTGLGAWLTAVPLLIALLLAMGPLLADGAGAIVAGLAILALAVAGLRREGLPLFLEQLVVPLLLVGGLSLGYGLYRHLDDAVAALLLLAAALLVATMLPQAWLRTLLGVPAAMLAMLALVPVRDAYQLVGHWTDVALLLLAWALVSSRRVGRLDDVGDGWLVGCLLLLCLLSGRTFLFGGTGDGLGQGSAAVERLPLSPALAIAAAALALRAWPGLRQWALLPVVLVLGGLSVPIPGLGGALFALALCCTRGRWLLAAASALAAAWVIGAFYYRLEWPLAQKAAWLAGAGAVLLLPAWRLAGPREPQAAPAPRHRFAAPLIGAGLLAALLVVNGGIWRNERLIAEGRPVFVALAPVDPRSLVQGDFMRLRFALPDLPDAGTLDDRPRVVARIDARGVATPLRLQQVGGPAPGADELLIELTPKHGGWVLVSDAWFFGEGQAARFERARFGEFRVLPDGRALLVGLADAQLNRLEEARPR